MIYLIKQLSWNPDFYIFKPGYSNGLDRRLKQYMSACPTTELISSRPGEQLQELIIHSYLHGLDDIGFIKSEWYEVPKKYNDWFIDEFSKSYDDMEKFLLENLTFISNDSLKNYLLEKYPSHTINLPDVNQDLLRSYIEYLEIKSSSKRLKYLCENESRADELIKILPNLDKARVLYDTLGSFICRIVDYDCNILFKLKNEGHSVKKLIINQVTDMFDIGERYTFDYIRETLQSIYNRNGLNKIAKAVDLEKYLIVCPYNVLDPDGNRHDEGYEVISVK